MNTRTREPREIERARQVRWFVVCAVLALAPLAGCSERDEYKHPMTSDAPLPSTGGPRQTAGDALVFGPNGATGGPSSADGVLNAGGGPSDPDSPQARLGLTWSEYVGRINAFFALNEMKKQYFQYGMEPPQLAATLRDLRNHCAGFHTSDVTSNTIRDIMDTLDEIVAMGMPNRSGSAAGSARRSAAVSLSDGGLTGAGGNWRDPFGLSSGGTGSDPPAPSAVGSPPDSRYRVTPDRKRELIRKARQDIDRLATMLGADRVQGDFPGSANAPGRVPVTIPDASTREPPIKLR